MVEIDGSYLTAESVVKVARGYEKVSISESGINAIRESNIILTNILARNEPVYGINTGFGIFADRTIDPCERNLLSRNLILSHAVATGQALPEEVVRASMLVRANALTKGFSGVRLEIIQTLVDMLNRCVTPVIPEQGSLGSSGDLSQLSHLALVFTTDEEDREENSGQALYRGSLMSGKAAMQAAGISRVVLGPKEGLALNNGATFSAGLASVSVYDAAYLLNVANYALGMSLEALMGASPAFDERLHHARGHLGQTEVARRVNEITNGSSLMDGAGRIQDAYSLRCAPQVQGAAADTITFVTNTIEKEINAATDNPLLFPPDVALSGGNFHGEPVGLAMDFLGIAMAEVAAISERRIFRLTDGRLNGGLPPMLVNDKAAAGLNSGLMMPQYTAASLVLENQTLAHPDSVHSLPTSGDQEDHNANAMTAARHARQIVSNCEHILTIELYTAARALDLRLRQYPEKKVGKRTELLHKSIREIIPYQAGDIQWGLEIEKLKQKIHGRELPILLS